MIDLLLSAFERLVTTGVGFALEKHESENVRDSGGELIKI